MEDNSHELTGLKEFDNSSASMARHKMARSKDDEFGTEDRIYYPACKHWDIQPELDVFAGWYQDEAGQWRSNSKCLEFFTFEDNALERDWLLKDGSKPTGVWWNDPHSLHRETLEKSLEQWQKHDLDILGILPGNTVRPPFFYENVIKYLHRGIEIEPLIDWDNPSENGGYMVFEKKGKPSEYQSVNGYLAIRYFSKESWTRFLKTRVEVMRSYGRQETEIK